MLQRRMIGWCGGPISLQELFGGSSCTDPDRPLSPSGLTRRVILLPTEGYPDRDARKFPRAAARSWPGCTPVQD